MKPTSNALRAARLLAALLPLAACAFADGAKPQDAAAPAAEAPLHEIGANTPGSPTPTPTPTIDSRNFRPNTVVTQFDDEDHNRVSVGDATYVGPNESIGGNAVAVMGPVKVDGVVRGNSVSVMGSNTVNGTVYGNLAAVMGSGRINGTVHGNAVVVLGTLKIGPDAHIDGHVVAAVGIVIREPGSYVGGGIVQEGGGLDFSENSAVHSWWEHAFSRGRPMAFGPHLLFFWLLSLCSAALYVLLALVFPGGMTKCGETLVERPGITLLTGILAIIALPVVFILLLITVVGIPIAFVVLPLCIIGFVIFGKAALFALIGRSVAGRHLHPALAVLVGVAIIILFLLVPVLGGLVWVLLSFAGYACAVTTLFTQTRQALPAGSPPPASVSPSVPVSPAAAAMAASAPEAAPQPQAAPAVLVPPLIQAPAGPVSEASLPKAGFWIRMIAILIDVLLVGIVTRMHDLFPVALAVYGALLWKLRGATIGDIILGIKVVRADGGQMEWVTVIVRALACFFSVIVVGLGFIWIAFDREKQGWHDKIAGTVVVRLPRGTSLV